MLFLFFESDYFEGNYALLSKSVRIFMSKIVSAVFDQNWDKQGSETGKYNYVSYYSSNRTKLQAKV